MFAENVIQMETVPRTQTAFRLKDSLLARIKWEAKRQKKSVNTFVEEVLEREVGTEISYPKVTPEFMEKARKIAEQYVLKDAKLPKEYEGLDGFGQAALDKELLAQMKYEEYESI